MLPSHCLGILFLKVKWMYGRGIADKIFIQGEKHELQLRAHFGCLRVILSETIPIPPIGEIICPGKLIKPPGTSVTESLLIEPSQKFQCIGKALVAKSLVVPAENFMIRPMNVSGEAQTIFRKLFV